MVPVKGAVFVEKPFCALSAGYFFWGVFGY